MYLSLRDSQNMKHGTQICLAGSFSLTKLLIYLVNICLWIYYILSTEVGSVHTTMNRTYVEFIV